MTGRIASIFRHPVKGFTPEALGAVDLITGLGVACDRIYAIENGPSGFDPAAPAHTPKQKFTVLAAIPAVAKVRTAYDDHTTVLHAEAPGRPNIDAKLGEEAGREAFAQWLAALIPQDVRGPLKVLPAPAAHRFTDHPLGQVSIINLASVRDLAERVGKAVDPLRFRANLYVEGWPAWAEMDWVGRHLTLGSAQAEVFKPIVRCAAIHVDPASGERDMDLTKALFDNYGHMFCGLYVHVKESGRVTIGDACGLSAEEMQP
jgi:uncharacterized protein YcbX